MSVSVGKLYTLYKQPNAQRELRECASSLEVELQKIGSVLNVRCAACSLRTVKAIWNNYEARTKHCEDNLSSMNLVLYATRQGTG